MWLPRLQVRNSGGGRSPSFRIDTLVNREPSDPDQVVICPDHRACRLASPFLSFEPLRCSSDSAGLLLICTHGAHNTRSDLLPHRKATTLSSCNVLVPGEAIDLVGGEVNSTCVRPCRKTVLKILTTPWVTPGPLRLPSSVRGTPVAFHFFFPLFKPSSLTWCVIQCTSLN